MRWSDFGIFCFIKKMYSFSLPFLSFQWTSWSVKRDAIMAPQAFFKCSCQIERFGAYFWQILFDFLPDFFYIFFVFRENTTCTKINKRIGQLLWCLRGCAPSKAKKILKCTFQMERFGGMFLISFVLIWNFEMCPLDERFSGAYLLTTYFVLISFIIYFSFSEEILLVLQ